MKRRTASGHEACIAVGSLDPCTIGGSAPCAIEKELPMSSRMTNRKLDPTRGYEANPTPVVSLARITVGHRTQSRSERRFSSQPKQKALTRPSDEARQYKPIASQGSKTQERRSIERRSLSVLLIALRREARWHAKGVEQRPFAFRINKLRATSGEWAGRQCAKGVGRVAPPASRVSESLKKRRKRRLLRVRYAERKGGARPASRSLSRWMLTTGKFIQAKLTRVNTFSKESFLW